ncbi:PQQ-dependent sugar dehydrogenase [uncultured Maribacter sp.]|uniref:PQQ-dependent sugar dehydrogenase n=1 Tax=uncultured Maribacter sp. TaxID=431308 RepID=UPI0030ED90E4|tara:strand:- start:18363 stop:19571 length:1209 start_codon:yes stop_codon:yes gene_type:complete
MKRILVLLGLVFIACTPIKKDVAVDNIQPQKRIVLEGLKRPWSAAFLSNEVALISEKDGHLLKVNLETKEKIKIKGFPSDLMDTITINTKAYAPGSFPRSAHGKRIKYNAGIFDVVLHPNFDTNHTLYLSYATQKGPLSTTKVISAVLENDSLTQVRSILVAEPYTEGLFHYGGGMTFGADSKLYITVGERLFSEINQPAIPIAQNLADKRGKIYRLNADGSIPDDNPDFGKEAVLGLYALGIRASQGITLNKKTGAIWFTEHGTNQGDEINLLKFGANYGWPIKTTGGYRGQGYEPPSLENRVFTDPKWYWLQTVAPTGLTFYTGDEFPQWKDNLFVSGLSRGSLWRVVLENETIISLEELFVNDRVRTRKVVQSPDGKLYLLTDETEGKMILIEPNTYAK